MFKLIYIVSLCLFRFVQKHNIKHCTRTINCITQLPKRNDNKIRLLSGWTVNMSKNNESGSGLIRINPINQT